MRYSGGYCSLFNTPFAAVIFVMEVVLREYKIHIFIPVMLAAAWFDHQTCFWRRLRLRFFGFCHVTRLDILVSRPMWYHIGLHRGANRQLMWMIGTFGQFSMTKRLLMAGLATGIIGLIFPEAMGAGLAPLAPVIQGNIFRGLIASGKNGDDDHRHRSRCTRRYNWSRIWLWNAHRVILLNPLLSVEPNLTPVNASFAIPGMAGTLASVLHAPLSALLQ